MRNKFGKNWVVAPRLTDKLKEKGYTVAFSQTKFNELKYQYDKEMGNSEYQARVRRLAGADDKVKWWEVDESFNASALVESANWKPVNTPSELQKALNGFMLLVGQAKDHDLRYDDNKVQIKGYGMDGLVMIYDHEKNKQGQLGVNPFLQWLKTNQVKFTVDGKSVSFKDLEKMS